MMPSGPAAPASSTKIYEGDNYFKQGEYDHILLIEIGDGIERKLPFNNGANKDDAANRFCLREGISKAHVEQIKQFIGANSLPYETRPKQEEVKEQNPLKEVPIRHMALFEDTKNAKKAVEKILEYNEDNQILVGPEVSTITFLGEFVSN